MQNTTASNLLSPIDSILISGRARTRALSLVALTDYATFEIDAARGVTVGAVDFSPHTLEVISYDYAEGLAAFDSPSWHPGLLGLTAEQSGDEALRALLADCYVGRTDRSPADCYDRPGIHTVYVTTNEAVQYQTWGL